MRHTGLHGLTGAWLLALAGGLAACGGGGSSNNSAGKTAPPTTSSRDTQVQGGAAKGPLQGAQVFLCELSVTTQGPSFAAPQCPATPTTTTDAQGNFSVSVT
ncbi:MAG: hypothetical protein L0099_08280, partial [Acidobacteria bacterium]|nr:hypothetical protein [Acidobacteriota bacterium]